MGQVCDLSQPINLLPGLGLQRTRAWGRQWGGSSLAEITPFGAAWLLLCRCCFISGAPLAPYYFLTCSLAFYWSYYWCRKCWGSEPMAKKEFLRCLRCKKVVLLKHGDRTVGRKLCWGCEEWLIIYLQIGRGLGIAQVSKVFWKQGFQDPRRLALSGKGNLLLFSKNSVMTPFRCVSVGYMLGGRLFTFVGWVEWKKVSKGIFMC